ncbi:DUF6998 domain-containing protein [Halomonas sp. KAO]|uniref:DUF6998 domain-containing protein n=1 Tax=Halomonas sp. KAO TaxID=2783858 RepID=UPI003B639803
MPSLLPGFLGGRGPYCHGGRVALRSCPEHLLVLKLDRQGNFTEAYNGPGELVWQALADKPLSSNGQYQVSLVRLAKLMRSVAPEARLPMVVSIDE